jgi:hypothetical protein
MPALRVSAVICFIIYFVMGFFGAARWGLATDGNLLVNEWGPAHYQGILNILLGSARLHSLLNNPSFIVCATSRSLHKHYMSCFPERLSYRIDLLYFDSQRRYLACVRASSQGTMHGRRSPGTPMVCEKFPLSEDITPIWL